LSPVSSEADEQELAETTYKERVKPSFTLHSPELWDEILADILARK
jgi:hypothetical protein